MHAFLERVAPCLHPGTYMGVQLRPEVAPNIAFHFKSLGGWPAGKHPVQDFTRSEIVSFVAQTYETISIKVHPDRLAPSIGTRLVTVAEATRLRHAQQTLKYSSPSRHGGSRCQICQGTRSSGTCSACSCCSSRVPAAA
jgi:hypothetical protein